MTVGASPTIDLRAGRATATVVPSAGGRLGQLTVDGRPMLKPRPSDGGGGADGSDGAWGMWGSYPLIPWSNRIAGGRFGFRGGSYAMTDLHTDGTALHGLVARVPWSVVEADGTSCVLTVDVATAPWLLTCRQRFALTDEDLRLEIAVTNRGTADVPLGIGIHPWFPAGVVQVPAERIWPAVSCIPTGPPRPVQDDEDLRTPVVPPVMDDCYTGLTGRSARVGALILEWGDHVSQVVVYTGEPGWVCVEPVTNANDGFNLHDRGVEGSGVIVLAAGQTVATTYRFLWP